MLSLDASAQSTVDENEAYCQVTTWEEAAKDIKADLKRTIRNELTEVKNLLGSRQQPCECSACAPDSSSFCRCHAYHNIVAMKYV